MGRKYLADSFRAVIGCDYLLGKMYEPDSEFHHGCCIGWDEQAAEIAAGYRLQADRSSADQHQGEVIH